MIRLIQLRSNFISELPQPILEAEYCAFGYFDGIQTKRLKKCETWNEVLKEYLTEQRKSLRGEYSIFDLLCIYWDNPLHQKQQNYNNKIVDDKDSLFWENKRPYLFISMIRFQKRFKDVLSQIKKIEDKIKEKYQDIECICYYTLDSNDFILCLKCKRYFDGAGCVSMLYELIHSIEGFENQVRKIHTIFSVFQEHLDKLGEGLSDTDGEEHGDFISCQMCCMIKNRLKVEAFEMALNEALGGNQMQNRIMGGNDLVYSYNEILPAQLFGLYAKNGLLTHTNKLYSEAFYNINTTIALKTREVM